MQTEHQKTSTAWHQELFRLHDPLTNQPNRPGVRRRAQQHHTIQVGHVTVGITLAKYFNRNIKTKKELAFDSETFPSNTSV